MSGRHDVLTVRNSMSRLISAAFGKGSGRARGTLKTQTGGLENPDGRSGKPRRAVWKTQTGGLGGRRLSSARRNARAAGVAPTLHSGFAVSEAGEKIVDCAGMPLTAARRAN